MFVLFFYDKLGVLPEKRGYVITIVPFQMCDVRLQAESTEGLSIV